MMNMKTPCLGIMLFALGIAINAQNATLTGTVTDEYGALIPDAKIEVLGEADKVYRVLTNSDGGYRIEVPSGLYKISVSRTPFTRFTVMEYWVPQYGSLRLDVALRCVGC